MAQTLSGKTEPMKSTQLHAFDDDSLWTYDAVAMTDLLKRRSVSSAELVEAAINRAERVDGVLAAIQLRDYAKARSVTELPHDGIFAGIPSFVKDNTNIAGWPSCHGSRAGTPNILVAAVPEDLLL